MEKLRKPFQGVRNIVRFNWHFYVLSLAIVATLLFLSRGFASEQLQKYSYALSALIAFSVILSLIVSSYIYDFSNLYKLTWLNFINLKKGAQIVNINAGFDETSILLNKKYNDAQIMALDFYDPLKHTELSIKRARNAYAPFPGVLSVSSGHLQLTDNCADLIFIVLAAHEIRNSEERVCFFQEAARIVKSEGSIIVTEHLRNPANFLAYNIGCLHFYSKKSWLTTFQLSGLEVKKEIKITPFIITFVLGKYGITS